VTHIDQSTNDRQTIDYDNSLRWHDSETFGFAVPDTIRHIVTPGSVIPLVGRRVLGSCADSDYDDDCPVGPLTQCGQRVVIRTRSLLPAWALRERSLSSDLCCIARSTLSLACRPPRTEHVVSIRDIRAIVSIDIADAPVPVRYVTNYLHTSRCAALIVQERPHAENTSHLDDCSRRQWPISNCMT
jgi:hypothetical protein